MGPSHQKKLAKIKQEQSQYLSFYIILCIFFFIFYEEVPNVWQPTFLHFFKNNMFVFPGLYFPCFFSPSQKGKSSL